MQCPVFPGINGMTASPYKLTAVDNRICRNFSCVSNNSKNWRECAYSIDSHRVLTNPEAPWNKGT